MLHISFSALILTVYSSTIHWKQLPAHWSFDFLLAILLRGALLISLLLLFCFSSFKIWVHLSLDSTYIFLYELLKVFRKTSAQDYCLAPLKNKRKQKLSQKKKALIKRCAHMLIKRQRTLYLILTMCNWRSYKERKNCKGFLTRRALYSYSKECPFPLKTKGHYSWIVPRKIMLLLIHISLSADIFWYCTLLNLLRIVIYVLLEHYCYKLGRSLSLLWDYLFEFWKLQEKLLDWDVN